MEQVFYAGFLQKARGNIKMLRETISLEWNQDL